MLPVVVCLEQRVALKKNGERNLRKVKEENENKSRLKIDKKQGGTHIFSYILFLAKRKRGSTVLEKKKI